LAWRLLAAPARNSGLRIGIAQHLVGPEDMREAPEVDHVVELRLTGREALVAARAVKASPACIG
jgi:hypothetical protein